MMREQAFGLASLGALVGSSEHGWGAIGRRRRIPTGSSGQDARAAGAGDTASGAKLTQPGAILQAAVWPLAVPRARRLVRPWSPKAAVLANPAPGLPLSETLVPNEIACKSCLFGRLPGVWVGGDETTDSIVCAPGGSQPLASSIGQPRCTASLPQAGEPATPASTPTFALASRTLGKSHLLRH
ncbi:hypothetical protein VTN96DRAFT_783 [Rasamsonia emersonii]